MAQINMASIEKKINAWAGSSSGRRVVNAAAIKLMLSGRANITPEEIANSTIEIMNRYIPAELSGISFTNTGISGGENGIFTLTFEFTGQLSRPSLTQSGSFDSRYGGYAYGDDGINNIVALFNNGYSASGPVYGEWHGSRIKSKVVRPGTHFVQSAASEIGSIPGVINVDVSGEYI